MRDARDGVCLAAVHPELTEHELAYHREALAPVAEALAVGAHEGELQKLVYAEQEPAAAGQYAYDE